jgi:hypothetical protein
MNKATRIDSNESLRKFIYEVDGFHDALLREAVLLHPGHVNQDNLHMQGYGDLPNARLIFQSQFEDVLAVILELKQVSLFQICPAMDFEFEGKVEGREVILYPHGNQKRDACHIRATEVEYKMLGRKFLGEEYRLIRDFADSQFG